MTPAGITAKLARVADIIGGVGFPHDFQGQSSGDIPFIKVSDLALRENAAGIATAANWVTRTDAKRLGARLAPPGSVVFPKVGAALLKNPRKTLLRESAIDNNLMAVAPRIGDIRFWRYVMMTIDLGELSGSGPLPFVSESQVRDLWLPFPAVEVQRRIADFLDAETARIDSVTETLRAASERLEERRVAGVAAQVLGLDFGGGRRSTNLPWARELPRSWREVRLSLVARMGSGHTPSRSRPEWWVDCRIPWITTGEVSQVRDDRAEVITETREMISDLGLANSSAELCPAGTVVLCRTASAGYSAVMGKDMATSQDFVTWTCGELLDPFYLLWCLRAMRQDLLGRLAMGSTHKTIYVPDLQMLRVPLPPVVDQARIVAHIRDCNRKIDMAVDAIRRQQMLLAERRQALITAAVTGEIDVSTASGRGIGV